MNPLRLWRESRPLDRKLAVWDCLILAPFNLVVGFLHPLNWTSAINFLVAVLIFGLGVWHLSRGPKVKERDRDLANARQRLRKMLP